MIRASGTGWQIDAQCYVVVGEAIEVVVMAEVAEGRQNQRFRLGGLIGGVGHTQNQQRPAGQGQRPARNPAVPRNIPLCPALTADFHFLASAV